MSERLSDGEWKDGNKHGHWVTRYANGNKREAGHYDEGARTGEWIRYHKDGSKAVVCHYEKDTYTGSITSYWPDGKRKETGQFNDYAGKWSDGKKTGPWTYYAEDGVTVWRVITYENGSRTKEDDLPLGPCGDCGHVIRSPSWTACPECGAQL